MLRARATYPVTLDDAKTKAKELYDAASAGTDVLSDEKCGDFFLRWIKAKKSLTRTTRHGYEEHISNYLLPHLGHIKRRDLKVRHLDKLYDAIEKENAERILHRLRVDQLQEDRDDAHQAWVKTAGYAKREERRAARRAFLEANAALREGRRGLRKTTSAATMHRINDTVSSAITWGIKRESAFTKNWAKLVELPPPVPESGVGQQPGHRPREAGPDAPGVGRRVRRERPGVDARER